MHTSDYYYTVQVKYKNSKFQTLHKLEREVDAKRCMDHTIQEVANGELYSDSPCEAVRLCKSFDVIRTRVDENDPPVQHDKEVISFTQLRR